MLTANHRKAIREAGPYYLSERGDIHAAFNNEGDVFLDFTPERTKVGIVTALNTIAGEDEAVARTREALIREAMRPIVKMGRVIEAGRNYRSARSAALRAAKKRVKR